MIDTQSIRSAIDRLIKPKGSLGMWELLAERLCLTQQTIHPIVRPAEIILFAADHGVIAEGISLRPSMMTTVLIEQTSLGRSASAVLATQFGLPYRIVDMGTVVPPRVQDPVLISRRIGSGTRNLAIEPAMTLHEFRDALEVGAEQARQSLDRASRVVIGGEFGVGNTTSASCVARLIADVPIEQVVGHGSGASVESLHRKFEVVESATDRIFARCGRSIDEAALAAICGFEIAALAGFYVQSARQRQTILLDGMVATAAALIAHHFYPSVTEQLIATHLSEEPAHRLMLDRLNLKPMLEWQMSLGEGTGAIALFPLVEGAAAWLTQMARIDEVAL